MKVKPVVARALANNDIDEIIACYLSESAEQATYGFIDALEEAYARMGRYPATDSPRYGHELSLPGLCFWPLTRCPHLVFYVERPDHIDVWRVLHGARHIPQWMGAVENS